MRKARPPRSNLDKKEQITRVKYLCNNDKIVVLKEDKGGAIIVMDKEDYILKMNEHINCSSYKKLNSNPIFRVIKEVRMGIKESNLDEKIEEEVYIFM